MVEKIFGKVLKAVRVEKNLTQEQLAYDCNLDRTYISLLERGLRQPTISTLFKLSKGLDIQPEDFITKVKIEYENKI